MTFLHFKYLAFCLVLMIFLASVGPSRAQTWSYQGSSICYDFGGGATTCYASGAIQRYATSREQFNSEFRAGYTGGEGLGNLVGSLISRWAEHKKIVEAERSDLRAQLRNVASANDQLLDELIDQQHALIDLWPRLASYVSPVAKDADVTVARFSTWASDFAKQKAESQKNIEIIIGAKDRKFLRQCLDTEQKRHKSLYDMASGGYAFKEFVVAVVGYYKYQEGITVQPVSQQHP